MTRRQLAEKCDEPGCLNISPSYEWLPLLLQTQLHGQLLQRMSRPSQWLSSLPGDQRKTIQPFPIGLAKTKWLFCAWDASRDHSPGDQIIQGVVTGWSTWSFLTNKAVQSLRINQGPTVTFMWHAKSQAKPQTYSDSHCFIIKPQPT